MAKRFLFLILFYLTGSCGTYNSSSNDHGIYNEILVDSGGDPNFPGAYQILQRRCINCHEHYHDNWNNLISNDLWILSGLVSQGNAAQSIMILKTIRNGTGNMPRANDLTQSEFDALKNWINNIP